MSLSCKLSEFYLGTISLLLYKETKWVKNTFKTLHINERSYAKQCDELVVIAKNESYSSWKRKHVQQSAKSFEMANKSSNLHKCQIIKVREVRDHDRAIYGAWHKLAIFILNSLKTCSVQTFASVIKLNERQSTFFGDRPSL